MFMDKRQRDTWIYTVAGLLAALLALVAINYLAGFAKVRLDITGDRIHTLSQGTRQILNRVAKEGSKVKVRFYFTKTDGNSPEELFIKKYADRVGDMLDEYRQHCSGLVIERLNPQPDSDAEDAAKLDGISAQQLRNGDAFYFGLAISSLDQKLVLPLPPDREKLLEYDLSRSIARVASPTKPIIGVMTPLPVFGQQVNPMMMRPGMRGTDPFIFISELKKDYEVRPIEMTSDKIDDAITLLLVIHPRDLSPKAEFAIDQFVLRGGKLIAFLDPLSLVDARSMGGNPALGGGPASGSSFPTLLSKDGWGLTFDRSKVVADQKFMTRMMRGGRVEETPSVLSIARSDEDANVISKDDPSTSDIDTLLFPFAGVFAGTPVAGLISTPIVQSTRKAQLVEGFMAQMSSEEINRRFQPDEKIYSMALRLSGKFKTAFTNGLPDGPEKIEGTNGIEGPKLKRVEYLKESVKETAVVLVGDTDFLSDDFSVQVQEMFGQRIAIPRNGNLAFIQNLVEHMAGDISLINARSKATKNRPFTVIRDKEIQAEENLRGENQKLITELQDTQRRLSELQRQKDESQRMILSKEQQEEIEKFRKKEAQARIALKNLKKNLRSNIESLQNRLRWMNILGVPLLVAIFGISVAASRQLKLKQQ